MMNKTDNSHLNIIHLKTVDSTNNYALQLAKGGAEHGTIVWADAQTNGRGKLDRIWHSEPGKDLLVSIIVRPKIKVKEVSQITLRVAELIRQDLIDLCGLKPSNLQIKPPNDLLLNEKKVGGILTESSSKGDDLEFAVIGIGLNLNSCPDQNVPNSTSFYLELSRNIEISLVLMRLAQLIVKRIN